jgi:lipopolysaccharide export system protein LptC
MTEAPPSRLSTLGSTPRAASRFADAQRHRRRVKRLKIALPLLAAGCVAVVFISLVVNRKENVSFTDGKTPAIEMTSPELQGVGENGKPYNVTAAQAVQTREGLIQLTDVHARIELEDGTMLIVAASGGVVPETGKGTVEGGVTIDLGGEYHFETSRADIDMKAGIVTGNEKVRVTSARGTIDAGGFRVEKSIKRVTFTGGVQSVLNPAEIKKPESAPTP